MEASSVYPLNILLVDDNEADAKIALRAFSKGKIKNNIYSVSSGQEVLEFLNQQGEFQDKNKFPRPDLILLDIKMPKLDGIGLLAELKQGQNTKDIPVIMLTSSKNEQDVSRSYHSGASGYIPKPVDYADFIKVVDGFNFYWQVISRLPSREGGF